MKVQTARQHKDTKYCIYHLSTSNWQSLHLFCNRLSHHAYYMSFNLNQFSIVFLCFYHPGDVWVWVCECVFTYVAPALSLVSMFMVPFNLSWVWLCWWGCRGTGAIYHTAPNALILCSWSSEGSSINIRLTERHPLVHNPAFPKSRL